MKFAHPSVGSELEGEDEIFIVPLLGITFATEDGFPSLVLEYANGGNLMHYANSAQHLLLDRLNRVRHNGFRLKAGANFGLGSRGYERSCIP